MSDDAKKAEMEIPAQPGTFTTYDMRELLFQHVLSNLDTYQPHGGVDDIRHLMKVMHCVEDFAMEIARKVMVNRAQLSPLPSFQGIIQPDPMNDPNDTQEYEMRYRVVEQVVGQLPHRDEVYSFEEATKEFGKNFVETYWGALGERCPHSMMLPGNKEIFFTVSRQPIQSLKQQMDQDSTALPTRSPRLG
ncbi:TPA: hypothetical protein ACGW3M_001151 [Pseudomonas aeruginosa]|uniref:hypothetical protein n=1 Tax=Pseudomonas aeruginosa TaxID=287 RepID=UPI0027F25C3D|nr:hypothetical protein [Pseudomonas aeruginosa]ELJ2278553.1 hypothetical protein [Pseudomonas aeruginosa]MBX6653570.1 hypothetical protein [Pseudomonas aeruginosa]HCH7784652.1 hypothetical protein [Pseudomonas aeruginosa]